MSHEKAKRDDQVFPVPSQLTEGSTSVFQSLDDYRRIYEEEKFDPDTFWLRETTKRLKWMKEPTIGLSGSFYTIQDGPLAWFADGVLNLTESCLDRHVETQPDKIAIIWEGDEPGDTRTFTYRELHEEVCRCANALTYLGLRKYERAIIYMGMVPEAAIAMLACARIGAVHSIVFAGFSAEALHDRVIDSNAEIIITQDEGKRGGKTVPLKKVVDEAVSGSSRIDKVLVYQRTGGEVNWNPDRDVWWHDVVPKASKKFDPTPVDAEHPLFILYTSGSTGRPKGLVHTTAGYLTWVSYTHREVFDLREDDIYGCVADIGWITGHSYIVYGPLANGSTTVIFESTPLYPDAGRYWDLVEKHKISIFYTAPTAIRALAAEGDDYVKKYDRSSLRVLGSVGEPIDKEAWYWYHNVVGDGRAVVVDTWWQTETGGHMIAPLAAATPTKPGSATRPLPGVQLIILDDDGRRIRGPGEGKLCIRYPWPGMARTVWGDHERYFVTYFTTYKPYYFTGDGCRRDRDGYYWITGRVDDVLNVSGHRMGTAEFESAVISANEVAAAAVVGVPHPVKGQGVYCYVVLQNGEHPSPELERKLNQICRRAIGAHAKVDIFQFVPDLPKTRSGKVMRRILRKIAEGAPEAIGDTSTLANPDVVNEIIEGANKL